MMKNAVKFLIVLVVLAMLAGCSSNKSEQYMESESKSNGLSFISTDGYYNLSDNSNDIDVSASDNNDLKKIIVSGDATIETQDLDEILSFINQQVAKYGGYIQSSSINQAGNSLYERYAYLTIRIPADDFEAFVNEAKESGNLISYSTESQDITDSYYDLQARLESLQLQQSRVEEFYKQAKTISELIEVEERLTEIQSEIAQITVRLKNYDLLTNYSTLNLTIREVSNYTQQSESFISRVWIAIKDSCINFIDFIENLILWLISAFWYILLAVLILFGLKKLKGNRKFFDWPNPLKRKKEQPIAETKVIRQDSQE